MPDALRPAGALPRVIVFDLDATLWYPEMYLLDGGAPFRADPTNADAAMDRDGQFVSLIGEARRVLQTLASDPAYARTHIAISSTCTEPQWAEELLELFTFTGAGGEAVTMGSLFGDLKEIYYAKKSAHHATLLQKVRRRDPTVTGYGQFLFFDDRMGNIRNVAALGVTCCHCPGGMEPGTFARGLEMWRAQQSSNL